MYYKQEDRVWVSKTQVKSGTVVPVFGGHLKAFCSWMEGGDGTTARAYWLESLDTKQLTRDPVSNKVRTET